MQWAWVTITNQSIIDSGQSISVTLETQSMFNTQRKTLLGLDLTISSTRISISEPPVMHFSEKALTEKVNIGDETVNNTMFGINLAYNTRFMWLTNLLNKIPTVNATQPSTLSIQAEAARLQPHKQKSGTNRGSSYVDDFESTQTGIDLRSPYAWTLASTPYQQGPDALFPEAALSNNVDYGKNRALLAWYYIDRMFTQRNSSLCPGYIASDLKQLSNPHVREVTSTEIFPDRQLAYGESNIIQTLNLSFYPNERGPYNLDAVNIDDQGNLMQPEKRWGGIMRKLDNTNFEQANIEYVQFWLMNPFLDPDNPNTEGGDFYLQLRRGKRGYPQGRTQKLRKRHTLRLGNNQFLEETVWGRVSRQNSPYLRIRQQCRLASGAGRRSRRPENDEEFTFSSYSDYLDGLRRKLSPDAVDRMHADQFSPFNDPAGDNYHFYRGYDYDEQRLGVLERYKALQWSRRQLALSIRCARTSLPEFAHRTRCRGYQPGQYPQRV